MNDTPTHPSIALASLGLSTRTRNILVGENVLTVEHLRTLTDADLMLMHQFGRHCLREVRAALAPSPDAA